MTASRQRTPSGMLSPGSQIYVAGHRGMAGSAIVSRLQAEGYTNIITRTHAELDLIDQRAVQHFFQNHRIDYYPCGGESRRYSRQQHLPGGLHLPKFDDHG